MKNFLDLLAIDHQINLSIKLGVIHDNGYPEVTLRINDSTIKYAQLTQAVEHNFNIPILDNIEIEISMQGKQYSETKETALLIESINIDGFEIVPQWTHLGKYYSERGILDPTSYMGINGHWRLVIDQPFYQWRHHMTGQGWLLEPV